MTYSMTAGQRLWSFYDDGDDDVDDRSVDTFSRGNWFMVFDGAIVNISNSIQRGPNFVLFSSAEMNWMDVKVTATMD